MAPQKEPDSHELINALPPTLRVLAARGTLRAYRKGTLILEEGTHGDTR